MSHLTILVTSLLSTAVLAVPAESKMYGQAAPIELDNLPVSKLRTKLESLPAPAQARALKWLNSFSFPANDIANINVDKHGGIFYSDTEVPEDISQLELEADPTQAGINPTDAFKLHSKPGAANTVYVNTVGYTFSGKAWNNYTGVSNYQAKPYDTDGNLSSFSTSERINIGEIWHRIAEDLAPFDIDVTTEAPVAFGPKVGHILITSGTDVNGALLPHGNTSGGIAYVGVWGSSNYSYYQPALVYYDNLGAGFPPYVAEAASHELGHNLALSHDGISAESYYTGHGAGVTSWAPIMGVGYYSNVTQWSKGDYSGANNTQDDLAIIQGKLSYSADDHGDDSLSATALLVDTEGFIASSNPEFDPLNVRTDNKGIIETSSDSDVFYFDTAAGDINLVITPAWDAYTRSSRRGANLDIKATLSDESGTVIVDDVLSETNAVISANVTAGRYYLDITGVGNAATPYSSYGSLSQYYISGAVVPASLDTTAPTPTPSLSADGTSRTSINLSSTSSIDDSGIVEYQFLCTAGGLGCVASTWQSDTLYTAANLASGTNYSYQVKARDGSGNETTLSDVIIVSTVANTAPVSNDDSLIELSENTAVTIDVLVNDADADGDSLDIDSFSIAQNGDVSQSGNQLVYTADAAYIGGDSFTYTITDGFGGYSTSTVSLTVIADANNAPTATMSASVNDLTVTYDGSSSVDGDGSIVSYSWDFGDGNNGSGSSIDYTYTSAGDYIATLTVTDNEGATSSASTTVTVTVGAPPVVAEVPAAPTNLVATLVKTGKGRNKVVSSAELSWTDNSNNETNFVIERCLEQTTGKGKNRVTTCAYSVYRTLGADVTSEQVGTESGYKYRVKAINDVGVSAYSNEASI